MTAAEGEHLAANRLSWDQRTPIHVRSRFYDVDGWLAGRTRTPPAGAEVLGDMEGLTLLHLQCHFGIDTLTWARAGARVTGLDFSPAAVDAAQDLAVRAGLADRARFVCANVYDAVDALGREQFDVVYVSLGALCWLPRIEDWAAQVGQLVVPGGRFFLHEVHPLSWALAEDRPIVERTYFEEAEPEVDDTGTTYTDSDGLLTMGPMYEWNHSLGETVTALLRHGLRLESLAEHDWTVFEQFPWLVPAGPGRWTTPPGSPRLPLTYSLLAVRP